MCESSNILADEEMHTCCVPSTNISMSGNVNVSDTICTEKALASIQQSFETLMLADVKMFVLGALIVLKNVVAGFCKKERANYGQYDLKICIDLL